jgi:hypothetical protein
MADSGTVPTVAPLSYAKIESYVERLVARHYPRLLTAPGVFPIQEFFEFVLEPDYGVVSGVSSRLPANVEGVTLPGSGDLPPQVVIAQHVYEGMSRGAGRSRFTGAHEVGHALIHARQIRRMLVSGTLGGLHRRTSIQPCCDPEWQANAFAGALLMPAPSVRVAVEQWGADEDRLMDSFGVSYSALAIRLANLKRWGKI